MCGIARTPGEGTPSAAGEKPLHSVDFPHQPSAPGDWSKHRGRPVPNLRLPPTYLPSFAYAGLGEASPHRDVQLACWATDPPP